MFWQCVYDFFCVYEFIEKSMLFSLKASRVATPEKPNDSLWAWSTTTYDHWEICLILGAGLIIVQHCRKKCKYIHSFSYEWGNYGTVTLKWLSFSTNQKGCIVPSKTFSFNTAGPGDFPTHSTKIIRELTVYKYLILEDKHFVHIIVYRKNIYFKTSCLYKK